MTSNVFCHTYHQGGYPATPPGPLFGVASLRVVHASVSEEKGSPEISDLLRLVETFDAERLTRLLSADWRRLGPLEFLRARIAPLIRIVGEEWAAARLEIRHEHFLSERLGDLLRSLRLPLEARTTGPVVACASLPGEEHGLGLQMVALLLAAAGCRILYLGTEVPPAQVAGLVKDLSVRAVAVSVSQANRSEGMAGRRSHSCAS